MDLSNLAAVVRTNPGLLAKRDLAAVAATVGGDGDDAAIVDGDIVVCAEAVLPQFASSDPRVAGIAGVVTVMNDIAATGARATALLDTVVAPNRETARLALSGIADAAKRYGVPVVGGHTTIAPGPLNVSTFGIGRATRPLRAAAARPGDSVVFVACLDGELVQSSGVSFFSHLRGSRAGRAAKDVALLADAAEAGNAWAARDVSMPGIVGSLIQFLESAGRLGAALDVHAIPRPPDIGIETWITVFPSFAFLLVGDPSVLLPTFTDAGLTAAVVAQLNASGVLALVSGRESVDVWDFATESLTGLVPTHRRD